MARRAARVAAERAAPGGGAVLLLDAGDQYQGTVWFSRYKGQEAVHFMNLLRYDAMVKRGGGERGVIPLFWGDGGWLSLLLGCPEGERSLDCSRGVTAMPRGQSRAGGLAAGSSSGFNPVGRVKRHAVVVLFQKGLGF